ncbi:MAG: SH3 domain-containing protein [Fretibacterium sp.]|nr:SH3 domain-containing protein [Fretibacterium sp.]
MRRFLSALAFLLLLTVPALALSDADYWKMMKDRDFARADKALTQAWNKAKKSFPDTKAGRAAFKRLRDDQREWIRNGRDANAQDLIGMEGYSRVEAYAEVTRERAKYLPELVREYLKEAEPKKEAPRKPAPKKPEPRPEPRKPAPKKEMPRARDEEQFLTESARREAAGDWKDSYPDTGICVGSGVRLRENPDTESEIVGRLNKGDQVITLEETSVDGQKWYAVDHPTQEGTAWVSARYIETYKGYEIGTPAYNMAIQVMLNFGLTPEKAVVLLGDPRREPENEGNKTILEYDDCILHYVDGKLQHVEVLERGLAFDNIKVGDSASKLRNTLGDPLGEDGADWIYGIDPQGRLAFTVSDGKICHMTWEEVMD